MFKDEQRDTSWNQIRQHDLHAFCKQLTPELFDEAARRANVRISKSPLNLVNLVWLGIAAAMHHTFSFAFVLTATLKLLEDQQDFSCTPLGKAKQRGQQAKKRKKGQRSRKSKHSPYREDPTQLSEEAFAQARQRMPRGFWMAMLMLLAERFQEDHGQHLDFQGFRLLAIDGTALTLPNDQRLREHYGLPKNGKRKKACPQARMVMITLPGVRIPIAYEVAPLCDSELTLAGRLMPHLRPNDLLLMDRGFLTYGMFWQIQHRGAFFGTRLKKQIKYKKRKRLGPDDWLVEWTPKDSGGRWKHLPRSIQLRVIHYKIRGFRRNAIVTNVLDPQRLSREDWVRVASDCGDNGTFMPGLYHRRWQIETTYFELKITPQLEIVAEPHTQVGGIRAGRSCGVLPARPLADGVGCRKTRPGPAAHQLQRRVAGTGTDALLADHQQPGLGLWAAAAALARSRCFAYRALTTRQALSSAKRHESQGSRQRTKATRIQAQQRR